MGAARAMVAPGEDGPYLSQFVTDALLDHPRLDEAVAAYDDEVCAVIGDGEWGRFLSNLMGGAGFGITDGEPDLDHQLFAMPVTGTPEAVIRVLDDVDALVALMAETGFVHPTATVRVADGAVPLARLATTGPGAARAMLNALVAHDGPGRPHLDGLDAASSVRAQRDEVVAVAVIGVRTLPQQHHADSAEAEDNLSWSGSRIGPGGMPTTEPDPDMTARTETWLDAVRERHGSAVDVGVPDVPVEASVALTVAFVDHVVSRHRGRFGIRDDAVPKAVHVHVSPTTATYAFDHGRGQLIGPTTVPNRVTVYGQDRILELVAPLAAGIEATTHASLASLEAAIATARASATTEGPTSGRPPASRASVPAPTPTPSVPEAPDRDNVVPFRGGTSPG